MPVSWLLDGRLCGLKAGLRRRAMEVLLWMEGCPAVHGLGQGDGAQQARRVKKPGQTQGSEI